MALPRESSTKTVTTTMPVLNIRLNPTLTHGPRGTQLFRANETRVTKDWVSWWHILAWQFVQVLLLFWYSAFNGYEEDSHLLFFLFKLHFQFCRHYFYKRNWTVLKEHLILPWSLQNPETSNVCVALLFSQPYCYFHKFRKNCPPHFYQDIIGQNNCVTKVMSRISHLKMTFI